MPPSAIEMFSTVGVAVLCIALGIMALSVFFNVMSRLNQSGVRPDTLAVRGILKRNTWATVHTTGAETFERVRFLGFTNTDSLKTYLPHQLNGMVILEDPEGCRYLIRAKSIRMIVVAPDQNPSSTKQS